MTDGRDNLGFKSDDESQLVKKYTVKPIQKTHIGFS